MKRKILNVFFALVLVFSFSLVVAVPATPALATAPATLNVYPFSLYAGATFGTAAWSTAQHNTGSASVLLTHDATNAGSDYVQFVPAAGTTLADLGAADGTPDWSWYHYTPATLNNWSQIELRFTQPGGDPDIVLDVTAMPLQNYTGTAAWVKQNLVQATTGLLYYGTDAAGNSYSWTTGGTSALTTVAGIVAAIKANTTGTDSDAVLDALVLTRVRVELWEAGSRACYIDDITINGTTYYGTIRDAIDSAVTSDTVMVAAGTYVANDSEVFPININKAITLESAAGAATTIINGAEAEAIAVAINGVTLGVTGHGFTLKGSSTGVVVTNAGAVSGITIQGNIFRHNHQGEGNGIYVNQANDMLIDGNTFYGDAIWTSSSNNSVEGGPGNAIQVFETANTDGVALTVTNNTAYYLKYTFLSLQCNTNIDGVIVTGNTAHDLGLNGVDVISGAVTANDLLIQNNTFYNNGRGVRIRAAVTGVANIMINYNDIYANANINKTTDNYGVWNQTSTNVTALNNFWGDGSGPIITGNDRGDGNAVSTYVHYEPWLTVSQATAYGSGIEYFGYNLCVLAVGWNVWSTPIALDPQCDTWVEYKTLGTNLALAAGANAYYFNGASQTWASVTDAYALTPCDAIYINMAAAQTSPILFSPALTAPAKTLYAGWNLVSASYFSNVYVPVISAGVAPETVLASVYYVTGANDTGYGQVVSPAAGGQLAWSAVRGPAINTASGKTMYPTKGYWVSMVNPGTLAGTVFTPVSLSPPA